MKKFKVLATLVMVLCFASFAIAEEAFTGMEIGVMCDTYIGADGIVKDHGCTHNDYANEGQYLNLTVLYQGATAPTAYCVRLYNSTPTKTSTLTALSSYEPAATYGYAGVSYANTTGGFPTGPTLSTNYTVTSATGAFSASGGSWGPVTYAVLATKVGGDCTGTTGKVIAFAALSQSRTLATGESLQITWAITQVQLEMLQKALYAEAISN